MPGVLDFISLLTLRSFNYLENNCCISSQGYRDESWIDGCQAWKHYHSIYHSITETSALAYTGLLP